MRPGCGPGSGSVRAARYARLRGGSKKGRSTTVAETSFRFASTVHSTWTRPPVRAWATPTEAMDSVLKILFPSVTVEP